jgi:hypothetical protein
MNLVKVLESEKNFLVLSGVVKGFLTKGNAAV